MTPHVLPWQNLLHAGKNLFSGLTALTAEFTIGEGELMTHDALFHGSDELMISYQELVRTFPISRMC
jgi:hypothetical protein